VPGTDLVYDPITRDFVDDGEGDWEETSTILSQVHHQILDRQGQWWADRLAGCSAWQLPQKQTTRTRALYEDAYRDALRVFTETGLAEDLVIEFLDSAVGRRFWLASLVDVQHGELDLTPLLSFGVEV
jgi:phage gp46-like protein